MKKYSRKLFSFLSPNWEIKVNSCFYFFLEIFLNNLEEYCNLENLECLNQVSQKRILNMQHLLIETFKIFISEEIFYHNDITAQKRLEELFYTAIVYTNDDYPESSNFIYYNDYRLNFLILIINNLNKFLFVGETKTYNNNLKSILIDSVKISLKKNYFLLPFIRNAENELFEDFEKCIEDYIRENIQLS